ncbi:5'-nucleotidase C-terminal domain-containing protein [Proteiniclasticum sp. C24MP]|uniref:5'-nucleotidase C-terminal domain-containing protein n=1 Tax=Proteiniclasticum sp. C24MP TaxID=3374101 RepID=UPI003754BA50
MRKRKSIRSLSIALALIFSFALIPGQRFYADEVVEPPAAVEAEPPAEEAVPPAPETEEPAEPVEEVPEEEAVDSETAAPEEETLPEPLEEPDDAEDLTITSAPVAPMAIAELDASAVLDYYSINDFHGTVDDSASSSNPGVARLQTYLLSQKKLNPHTYFLSAGDHYQGSPISNLTHGEVVNEILSHMGLLASAIGNHEFDWGSDLIPLWAQSGGFPFVASNIEVEEAKKPAGWDDHVKPYYIHEVMVEGVPVRVGFVGIATPETSYKTTAEYVDGFTFTDPTESVNYWTNELRTNHDVDAVIALTHLGAYQDGDVVTGEAADLAKGVTAELDAIVTGHTHQVIDGMVNGIVIVQGQYNGRSLSKVSLAFDLTGTTEAPVVELTGVTGDVINIRNMKVDLVEDPAVKAIIDEYYVVLGPILEEELGTIAYNLPHDTDTMQVTPMGQFVAAAMAELGGTEIAIINGGGIRGGFEAGTITMGDMYSILPFDNTLVTLEVTGAELKKLIEHGIYPPTFRPGQFYGIEVWYDKDAEAGEKITKIQLLDGTPVEDDAYYTVSTLDFLITGGDKYDYSKAINVVDTYLPLRDLIAEAIEEMGEIEFVYETNLFIKQTLSMDYYAINDFHGNVDSSGSSKNPGLARIQTFLRERIAENAHTYFLSAGDHFQGTAISNLTHGEVVNEILKEMNLLASAVGNHEFDWGSDLIPTWAKDGEYLFLASNIEVEEDKKPEGWDDYVVPYMVQEHIVNGTEVKIGFIGIATPETKFKTAAENVVGYTFTDPAEATNKWAKVLKEQENVDAIIALTHLGSFQKDGVVSGEIVEYANEVEGIDAIFTGHTHQVVNGRVNDIAIVQGGYNGRNLSQITLDFEVNDTVVTLLAATGNVINMTELIPELEEDAVVKTIVDKYYEELAPILDEVLGTLTNDLPHDTDTMQVTPMGQFIAKSLAEIGGTQIAIINGGGIRRGFDKGDITMGLMYELLPFDNTLVTLKVTGAELKKLIEHGLHPEDFRPGQFYGIEVWYDDEAEAGNRISTIRLLDGTLVKDDETYTVSTLDFLLTGGDNYDYSKATDVVDTYIPVRDVIAEMIREKEVISHVYVEHLHVGEDIRLPAAGSIGDSLYYGMGVMSILAAGVITRKGKKKAA